MFKILRLLVIVLLCVHVYACTFWKLVSMYRSPDQIEDFLLARSIDSADDLASIYMLMIGWNWVCMGLQLACFYFVFTVFTTVGFGDISAVNKQEQIFCVFMFLTAVSLFGTLISQLNEIVAKRTSQTKELDQNLESFLDIHPRLEMRPLIEIWGWERFKFWIQKEKDKIREIMDKDLPEGWKLMISQKIENNLFSKIPFLAGMSRMGEVRATFSAELLMRCTTRYYPSGSIIADSREEADGMMVITSGKVTIEVPLGSINLNTEEAETDIDQKGASQVLYTFSRGDSIGSSCVIGDSRWAGSYGVQADFVAQSHCSVEFIPLKAINQVLGTFEFFPVKCKVLRARENQSKFFKDLQVEPEFWGNKKKPTTKIIFLWTLVARQISRTMGTESTAKDGQLVVSKTNEELRENYSCTIEISDEQAAMIQEVFKLFDTGGSGSLSEVGLASALFSMGFSTYNHHEMAKSLLRQYSDDGTLTLKQFTELMRGQLAGQDPEQEIVSTFHWICGDFPMVKAISFDLLKSTVRKLKIKLPDEEIQDMIKGADRDDDGLVDLREYVSILKNSTWV